MDVSMTDNSSFSDMSDMSLYKYTKDTKDTEDIDTTEDMILDEISLSDNEEIEKVIFKLMTQKSVDTIIQKISPYFIIFLNNDFLNPHISNINKYIKAFDYVCNNDNLPINYIFNIEKVLSQSSKNGKIYIINIKSSIKQKLLLKAPLNMDSDNMSYEYYVGKILNELRIQNIPCFTLTYGRFAINLSNSDILSTFDNKSVSHVIYEYIRNDNKTITLYDYISTLKESINIKEIQTNLINILMMLLISLYMGQTKFNFTHYDLHLNNILLYKLDNITEYQVDIDGSTFKIILEYFPYIIDFGRSHINNELFTGDKHFVDVENKKTYTDFEEFSNNLWNDRFFYANEIETNILITNILNNKKIASRFKKDGLKNKNEIKSVYFTNHNNKLIHNIFPTKFNSMFDTYKLIRSMCANILSISNNKDIDVWDFWENTDAKLDKSYPLYIPGYFHMSSDYKSFDNKNINTLDILKNIYKSVPKTKNIITSNIQIGGGTFKFKKIKKYFNLKNLAKFYDKTLSKLTKEEYIVKPNYNLVINKSVELVIQDDY